MIYKNTAELKSKIVQIMNSTDKIVNIIMI